MAHGIDALTLLRSEEQLAELRDEWSALLARTTKAHFTQSFDWAANAWRLVAQPRGRRLLCIVLRREGRLVGVWPTVLYSDHGLRVLRPLGYEGSEYAMPLIEDRPEDETRRMELIWAAVRKATDLVLLPQLKTESTFARIVWRGSTLIAGYWPAPAPVMSRNGFDEWAQYQATVPSSLRYEIRRATRRLSERGNVVLERQRPEDCAALIDWMIDHKSRHVAKGALVNHWIGRSEYRDFLVAMTCGPAAQTGGDSANLESGGVAVFALKVDGAPIAARLVSFDRTRAEGFLVTYDDAWRDYSPGNVLCDFVLRWAFERGLDFDFRPGQESYKYKWATASVPTATWLVSAGWRGLPRVWGFRSSLAVARVRMAVSRFLRDRFRRGKGESGLLRQ